MKYYGDFDTVTLDELQAASNIPVTTFNISVENNATIQRGDLLAAANFTDTFKLASAGDSSKVLAVARDNFVADSNHTVTAAYFSGTFHKNKIRTASSDSSVIDSLQNELRRQNLHFVKIKE